MAQKRALPTREINDQEDIKPMDQQLDMCETGPFRGDEILHGHGRVDHEAAADADPADLPDEDGMQRNFHVDMSEGSREGDEMTGDEHSAGLQGGEPELEHQKTIESGMPGEETEREDDLEKNSKEAA